jgi:hypothetical protein
VEGITTLARSKHWIAIKQAQLCRVFISGFGFSQYKYTCNSYLYECPALHFVMCLEASPDGPVPHKTQRNFFLLFPQHYSVPSPRAQGEL